MKALTIFLSLFLCTFTNTYAGTTVSFTAGVNGLTTDELSQQGGVASGTITGVKIGKRRSRSELGLYYSAANFKTSFKHDSLDYDLVFKKVSFGAYTAYYGESVYFELGYGRGSVKETLSSSADSATQILVKKIYNLSDKPAATSEVRALMGAKIIQFETVIITVFAQKTIFLESSHDSSSIGLELKIGI